MFFSFPSHTPLDYLLLRNFRKTPGDPQALQILEIFQHFSQAIQRFRWHFLCILGLQFVL